MSTVIRDYIVLHNSIKIMLYKRRPRYLLLGLVQSSDNDNFSFPSLRRHSDPSKNCTLIEQYIMHKKARLQYDNLAASINNMYMKILPNEYNQ